MAISRTWILIDPQPRSTNAAMREPVTPLTEEQASARRVRARRMAWAIAGVALLVYVGFILSGVLAR
jgi:hypothetical protein